MAGKWLRRLIKTSLGLRAKVFGAVMENVYDKGFSHGPALFQATQRPEGTITVMGYKTNLTISNLQDSLTKTNLKVTETVAVSMGIA